MSKIRILPFALLILSLAACGNYTKEKSPTNSGEGDLSNLPLSFETLQAEVFRPRCLACHEEFADYSVVAESLEFIIAEVEADRMPKRGGPLNEEQKKLLETWAQAGAPE